MRSFTVPLTLCRRSLAIVLLLGATAGAGRAKMLTIPATSFTGSWGSAAADPDDPSIVLFFSGTTSLYAPFRIKSGAIVTGIALDSSSSDLFNSLQAVLYRCTAGGCTEEGRVQAGTGSGHFTSPALSLPIDNGHYTYVLQVTVFIGMGHPAGVSTVGLKYTPAP